MKWTTVYVSYIRKYIGQYGAPDIIHAHTYLGAMVAFELQKHHTIPYIVTEHYTGWMDGSIRKHHRRLGIKALNGAKKVICVSGALKEAMQAWIKYEIEVVPNFIDFEIFKPDLSLKSSSFEMLGVGDLIPRKQWDHLIQAFAEVCKEIDNCTLTIIGEGPLRGELAGLIRSLQLESKIDLIGRKTQREVAQAMQRVSVLVHTSQTETFGLIYLEALACGLSVISYENGGVDEFKGMMGVEVLKNRNLDTLQKAIIKSYLKSELNRRTVFFTKNNGGLERYMEFYFGKY